LLESEVSKEITLACIQPVFILDFKE